jgi:hypothetical protein
LLLGGRREQPFRFQPRLGFCQQREQRTLAGNLHALDHDLVVRAAGIGRQLSSGDDLDPVFRHKTEPLCPAAPHHPVQPGTFVLEAEIKVSRCCALHARKLAAHPHIAEAVLHRALEQRRDLGDRKRRGVVARRFAR